MGQYRHLRMARLSHADQGRFLVPRLDPCRPDRTRPGSLDGSCTTYFRTEGLGHPGMAQLLLQVSHDRPGALPRARLVHSVDEAEEHAASPKGRGTDHAPWTGIL